MDAHTELGAQLQYGTRVAAFNQRRDPQLESAVIVSARSCVDLLLVIPAGIGGNPCTYATALVYMLCCEGWAPLNKRSCNGAWQGVGHK